MLAHILALVVGFASFCLYMSAFFFPEVHRKYDFVWSGVGMFYALVLWVCAGRITGGVLLGQTASVALLGWLGWQMLSLRRSLTPADQQTPLPGSAQTVGELVRLKLRDLQTRLRSSPAQGALTDAGEWTTALKDSVAPSPQPRRSVPPLRQTPPPPPSAPAPERPQAPRSRPAVAKAKAARPAEPPAPVKAPIEPPAPEPVIVAETVDDFDEFEPSLKTAPARPAAAPFLARKRRGNLFTALRDRVQGRGKVPPTPPSRKATTPSIEELADELEEFADTEIMVAVLEDSLPPDRPSSVEVEIIEVSASPAEPAGQAPAADTASPMHDDGESDTPCVTVADAVVEEELNWEAGVSPDALDQPAPPNLQPDPATGAADWSNAPTLPPPDR